MLISDFQQGGTCWAWSSWAILNKLGSLCAAPATPLLVAPSPFPLGVGVVLDCFYFSVVHSSESFSSDSSALEPPAQAFPCSVEMEAPQSHDGIQLDTAPWPPPAGLAPQEWHLSPITRTPNSPSTKDSLNITIGSLDVLQAGT